MKKKVVNLILAVFLLLAGCAPDPRNEAEAYAMMSQADQEAADAAVMRQMTASGELQRQAEEMATADSRIEARSRIIRYGSAILVIMMAGLAAATIYVYASHLAPGLASAAVTAADLRARLMPLDHKTRQYPLLMQPQGDGKITLTNANTGLVLELETGQCADRQMVAASAQVQAIGLVADASVQAKATAALEMMQTPVVYDLITTDNPNVRTWKEKVK